MDEQNVNDVEHNARVHHGQPALRRRSPAASRATKFPLQAVEKSGVWMAVVRSAEGNFAEFAARG